MVIKKIHDDIYGVDLLFASGCSIEIAQQKARRRLHIMEELAVEITDAGAFFQCTTREKHTAYVIWCRKSRNIQVIAHEAAHLVFAVFKDRGIPTTQQNQETFAYYLDYWVGVILKPRAKALKRKK